MHAQRPHDGDDALVQQSLSGSREAFGLLVERYSRAVRATCLARLGTCQDLEDLVQEAFLRAFKGLARLEDRRRFGAFVHRIAQNICVDRLRRQKIEDKALAEVALEPTESHRAEVAEEDDRERLREVRRQVGRLPFALREAVLLFYFERMSHARIATALDITEAAVNQRLHRARVRLRKVMDPAGGGR